MESTSVKEYMGPVSRGASEWWVWAPLHPVSCPRGRRGAVPPGGEAAETRCDPGDTLALHRAPRATGLSWGVGEIIDPEGLHAQTCGWWEVRQSASHDSAGRGRTGLVSNTHV